MDAPKVEASQQSESSSILDLSWSYGISDNVLQSDPTDGMMQEEDIGSVITSSSSVHIMEGSGGTHGNICDDNDKSWARCDQQSIKSSLPNITLNPTNANNLYQTSSDWEKDERDGDDAKIRNTLDAFYNLQEKCNSKENPCNVALNQLSIKIAEMHANQQMYALRTLQVARIILNRDGANILQSDSKDSAFSSPTHVCSKNPKPIPGLSKDVIKFVMKENPK
ncbi:shieldin complex subunit 1 isoform 1-T2 [Discoglossus pictus]